MRKYEFPATLPLIRGAVGGWAAFPIPHSQFLIRLDTGRFN